MNTYSQTRTETSTHTESRARKIMDKVTADLAGPYSKGLINQSRLVEWMEILDLCLKKNGLTKFEIQFTRSDSTVFGLIYSVVDDGTIYFDDPAGGIDWFEIESNTIASIVIFRNEKGKSDQQINDLLREKGWVNGGASLTGNITQEKNYSIDGFGVKRNKVGWN
jgi:hypothetical protein